VTDYADIRSGVRDHLTDEDLTALGSVVSDDHYDRTARLIGVDLTIVRQSIERLLP
jgi:hypothetical protein